MTLAATIDLIDSPVADNRVATRVPIGQPSTVRTYRGPARDVLVQDLSRTGFRYFSNKWLPVGTPLRLGLAGAGTATARVVRQEGHEHGCEFDTPLTREQLRSAFTSAGIARVPIAAFDDLARYDRWPRGVRLTILIGCSVAAWGLVILLAKALA